MTCTDDNNTGISGLTTPPPFLSRHFLKRVLLAFLIIMQLVMIYHSAFRNWQGPGDFGGNINYIPAIMIGAGKGFVDVDAEILGATPALNAFVAFDVMRLDPAALPEDLETIEPNDAHKWYRYMSYTVGYFWRLFGISWNAMRVLCVAVLFITALMVYRIARLMMPVGWSLFVAHAFAWNSAVLMTMHISFRDFSKAFFILWVVLILGALIKTPSSRRRFWGAAVSVGLILGVGMGFRRDMQVVLLLALVIMMTCRLHPIRLPHLWRLFAAVTAVLVFVTVSFPILTSLYSHRWVNAHDMIMGFSTRSDNAVGLLSPASYEKHYLQHDLYCTYRVSTAAQYGLLPADGYLTRLAGDRVVMGDSDRQQYILASLSYFPADFLSKAYAAVLYSTTGLVETRFPFGRYFHQFGFVCFCISLILIAAQSPRQAGQLLLLICLFCGYTSIQFDMRHAFPTTLIPYLFGCYVLYHLFRAIKKRPDIVAHILATPPWRRVLRIALWTGGAVCVFLLPLKAAQYIQEKQVAELLATYQQAERIPVAHQFTDNWEGHTLISPVTPATCSSHDYDMRFERVEVSVYVARFSAEVGPLEIDLIYDWYEPRDDLSGAVLSHTRAEMDTGEIALYFPVYEITAGNHWNVFTGIRLPHRQARHFLGFSKLTRLEDLGYLVNLTVPEKQQAFVSVQSLRLPWPYVPRSHDAYRFELLHLSGPDNEVRGLLRQGDTAPAIALIQSILDRRPGSIQFNALLAQAHFQAERPEKAWDIVTRMLDDCHHLSQLYRRIDMLFMDIGGIQACYLGWRRIATTYPEYDCARRYFENAKSALRHSTSSSTDYTRYDD